MLRTILIVDDDIVTNRIIQTILSKAGFNPISALSLLQTKKMIAENTIDLILLDINLPDGNGISFCKSFLSKAEYSQIPVLFISSNEDVNEKVNAFEAGAMDYITKPLNGLEVIARVKTHLRMKQAYEALVELQAERVKRLASAQKAIMPNPQDNPAAKYSVILNQVLKAGGDFYDVVESGNDMYDYLVADASGHDLAASFWTAALKMLTTEYANSLNTPKQIINYINTSLCRILPKGVFFTLLYARINRQLNRITIVNAAHPPAIILPTGQKEPIVIEQEGEILGSFSDASFNISEISVEKGSRLFLYSDGLIELKIKRSTGINELLLHLTESRDKNLHEQIQYVIDKMTFNTDVTDDIVLMGIEI
jgi:sigma-B regulation protein RsbU (phosphoserine phosphatase)